MRLNSSRIALFVELTGGDNVNKGGTASLSNFQQVLCCVQQNERPRTFAD